MEQGLLGLEERESEEPYSNLPSPARAFLGRQSQPLHSGVHWGGKENWQWLKLERLRLDYKRGCFPMRPENGTGCPERLCCLLSSELTLL